MYKPVCVRKWFFKKKSEVKLLSHIWQANGRSPWWTESLCTFKIDARVNDLSHWSHWCGRSPVYQIKWIVFNYGLAFKMKWLQCILIFFNYLYVQQEGVSWVLMLSKSFYRTLYRYLTGFLDEWTLCAVPKGMNEWTISHIDHMQTIGHHRELSFYELPGSLNWQTIYCIYHKYAIFLLKMNETLSYAEDIWFRLKWLATLNITVPVCESECRLRLNTVGKCLSHFLQACGRIPLWTTFLCTFKLVACVNELLHISQICRLSPVCLFGRRLRWCPFNFFFWASTLFTESSISWNFIETTV